MWCRKKDCTRGLAPAPHLVQAPAPSLTPAPNVTMTDPGVYGTSKGLCVCTFEAYILAQPGDVCAEEETSLPQAGLAIYWCVGGGYGSSNSSMLWL